MYHAVVDRPPPLRDWCFLDGDRFEDQIRWLRRSSLDILPLDEAVARLARGELIRPTVALTFDDGYRNNITTALPILRRYEAPATIFLTTDLVGSDRTLWPWRLCLALRRASGPAIEWAGVALPLRDEADRLKASRRLQNLVKERAGADPGAAVAEIEASAGAPVDPAVPADSPYAMMNEAEVRAGLDSGLLRFGAHSRTHPLLSWLDDRRLAWEIDGSVAAVSRLTGAPCRTFAYPNGRACDFDGRAVERLRQGGVSLAVTTNAAPNRAGGDPLRLNRWGVGAGVSPLRFRAFALNLHPSARRRS